MKIAISSKSRSKNWRSLDVSWKKFTEMLKKTVTVPFTRAEFLERTREEQASIKDIGGYMAGELEGARRISSALQNRTMLTLDVDFAKKAVDFISDFQLYYYQTACVIHGTIKHTEENPRLRLIVPLTRPVSPLEYEAIARKFAEPFDINIFDKTTFQAVRMMYWPTKLHDVEPMYFEQQGEELNPDGILKLYGKGLEWRDPNNWVRCSGEKVVRVSEPGVKLADPLEKEGLIGTFCRAFFPITKLFDEGEPLEGVYIAGREEGRYRYAESNSADGVDILDGGRFLRSFHDKDPAGTGKPLNAYDLFRLHNTEFFPEEAELQDFITTLEQFIEQQTLDQTKNLRCSLQVFADDIVVEEEETEKDEYETPSKQVKFKVDPDEIARVYKKLDKNARTGEAKCTVTNVLQVFSFDPRFKDAIRKNIFAHLRVADSVRVPLWGVSLTSEEKDTAKVQGGYITFNDAHISAITRILEFDYHMTVNDVTLKKALHLTAHNSHIHPLREYLNTRPEWDGKPRLSTTLHEAFDLEKNAYHAEVWTKTVVAAVARAYHPGIKFDNMLVLVGAQGVGKSTFVQRLTPPGSGWFTSSIDITKAGEKESMEKLLGVWIVEVAELSNRKADQDKLKNYISSQSDRFRIPYESTADTFKRQNIFIATTNNIEFLVDTTGSRRFWPVQIGSYSTVWSLMTPTYVAQLLAEAIHIYREISDNGKNIRALEEYLLLSELAEDIAVYERLRHTDVSEEQQIVNDYVNIRVPKNWSDMTVSEKREYFRDYTTDTISLDDTMPLSVTSPREVYEVAICADGRTVQTLGEADSRRLKKFIQAQGFIKPYKFKYIAADGTATGHKKDGRLRGYAKNI